MRRTLFVWLLGVLAIATLLVGALYMARSGSASSEDDDLKVNVDLPREEAKLAHFFRRPFEASPEAFRNYVLTFADNLMFEAAIAEADKALTRFPNDPQLVAVCVPNAARCYGLLGRERASVRYLEDKVVLYGNDARPVRRGLGLGAWLRLCVRSHKVWLARRKGAYASAAQHCGDMIASVEALMATKTMDIVDIHALADLVVTQGKLWEGATEFERAATAYERAMRFIQDNLPSQENSAAENSAKRILESWAKRLPDWIARCKHPASVPVVQRTLARVDWLIEEGEWQMSDGRNYPAAQARFEEALTTLRSFNMADLDKDTSARYQHLRDVELPAHVKGARETEDLKNNIRKQHDLN
jgi:tetratricopeptide (TPR) repeat protein